VNIEHTSHNSIVLAICVPKIIKFGEDSMKFWQKQVRSFFCHILSYHFYGCLTRLTSRIGCSGPLTVDVESDCDCQNATYTESSLVCMNNFHQTAKIVILSSNTKSTILVNFSDLEIPW